MRSGSTDGVRSLLSRNNGVLVGKARVGDAEGSVRIESAADGTLREALTANVFSNGGNESGDVTNTVVFVRRPD